MIDREQLRTEVQRLLDSYPPGTYDKAELLSDVRHELEGLIVRLGLARDTPVLVDVEDGELTVRIGKFLNLN